MRNRIKVFAGTAGRPLADKVCERLSIDLGKARVARFADGEVDVQIEEDVRGADVFIVNTTGPPAENLIEMVLLAEAAHGSSAGRVTVIPTYLGYNRQDRKDRPRRPISARTIIRFIAESGADRVLLVDLHSEPTMALFGNRMQVDHLYASAVSVEYLRKILTNPFVVASPDKGGGPRAEAYARLLGQDDFVLFSKSRATPGVVEEKTIKIIGDVRGKNILFVDDMIDTAGTLVADTIAAKKAGAKKIYAFATHGLFSRDAFERLDTSGITEVITTDSVGNRKNLFKPKRMKLTELSIVSLLAQAIRRLHDGESLSLLIPKP
ncbi:hypothetical protein A3A38_01165 [Candidatus Kaiserbacteria bacterium RIFCSPLOWO2_01_FULL_53_17]|uniref:ribose-phosphate diphosphokinase n=1 Tax=Candidatus Kaiserbacteria bacterium RIFCSPLOWO2_01_FULL_53_17 TaxID=1798511 RepID=A0A1F6EH86_9BACT|nr:MAG: hypothetical protein A3A38_01165 [Candidatus Kaiserbacteria bacterium RIFCSPLOWO2_01_FULL_53_17]